MAGASFLPAEASMSRQAGAGASTSASAPAPSAAAPQSSQWASFEAIDSFLCTHGSGRALEDALLSERPAAASERATLRALLSGFVKANDAPQASPNLRRQHAEDPLLGLVRLLRADALACAEHAELALLALRALKVLSRKQTNRRALGERGIAAVLRHLREPSSLQVAAEGANVLLNACYEADNVDSVLRLGGVPAVVAALGGAPTPAADALGQAVQANSAGAIQSICYQERGRRAVRECGAVGALVGLLASQSVKVRTRAAGAVHNLSSDAEAIRAVRKKGGIPLLIHLLEAPQPQIAASAAGALQNVSREVASRKLIREGGAVPPLMGLLLGDEMQAQVCAAGALLNILGPEAGANVNHPQRNALGRLISQTMTMAHAYAATTGEAFAPNASQAVERLSRAMVEAKVADEPVGAGLDRRRASDGGKGNDLAAMLGAPTAERRRPKSGRRGLAGTLKDMNNLGA